MEHLTKLVLPFTALMALAACDAPNPDDYGGGARGKAVAKCIMRTERADSSITREQAGEMCGCITDKTLSALTGSGMAQSSLERAFLTCAKKAGIAITD